MHEKYIFLIEHPKRELEFIKKVCDELKKKNHITFIYSIHFELWKINLHQKAFIFLPYCLSEKDYPFSAISKRKGHVFVNMNWEQILSPINKTVKIIKGSARKNHQLVWNSDFYYHLVKTCKIEEKYLLKSINPTAFLFYNHKLSIQFQKYLSDKKIENFIFFPLNYNWALMGEAKRRKRIKRLGYNPSSAHQYIEYSEKHLLKTLNFIEEILLKTQYVIVLRPHPGISINAYYKKIKSTQFNSILNHPRFIIDNSFSAINWIHSAKITVSNWSTLIYDAWLAGFNSCYFWPENIPELIDAYHTKHPPKIKTLAQLASLQANKQNNISENFQSLISDILSLSRVETEISKEGSMSLISILKQIRSFIRYMLIKLKMKKLINPIILLDHFEVGKDG